MIATIFYRYLKGKNYTKLANHFLTIIKKDKIKLFRKDKRDVPTMKQLLESYNKENKSKGKKRIYESNDESDIQSRVTKKKRKKYTISSDSDSDSNSDSDSDSNSDSDSDKSSSPRRQSSHRDKSSESVNKDNSKEKSKELNRSTNKVTDKRFKSKEIVSSSDSSDSDWLDPNDSSSDSSDSDNDDNQSVRSFSSSSSIQVIEPAESLTQKNPQEKSNGESNKAIEESNKNDAEKINEKDKTSEDKKVDEGNGDGEVEIVEKQIEKEKNEQEKGDSEKELFCSTGFLGFPDIKDTKFDYAVDVKILINYNTGTKRLVIIDSDLKAVHLDKRISKKIKLTKERNFDTHVRIKLDKNQVEPKGHTLLLKFQFAEQTGELLKVFKEAKKDEDFLMIYEKQPKSKESIEKAKLLQLPINFFD